MTSPAPFARRPQATAFSIEDLLERVRRGEVRVPKFQRPFLWDAQDIRALLDSIYRGYPIGTLLFWKKEAPAASVSFGPVRIDALHTTQALWAVDGQQRITALTGVLLHPPYSQDSAPDDFVVHFDLEKEQFVHLGKAQPPHSFLPMNVVADSELLLGWLDRYPGRAEHPEHTRTALRLSRTLREYQVQAYIIEADEERTPRLIFERMNTAGKPLRQADVFNALHGHTQQARPTDLLALSRNLSTLGFGTLEQQWLLKAVLAVHGLDISRDFRQQLRADSDIAEALSRTELALRDVIVFLKRDAAIPHIELLPYQLPLLLLARFFHLHPEPSARSRELLARWLWRGALTARHGGMSSLEVRESLASMGADEERSVQNLLSQTPRGALRLDSPLDPSHHFDLALSKLQVNALLALSPRHIQTGELLDTSVLFNDRGRYVFRPVYPSMRGELARSIANYLVHPPTGNRSLLKLLKALPSLNTDILRSHGMTPESFTALLRDKPSDFLHARKRLLDEHAAAYFETRARWGESDRPSLQSLIVPDEED